MAFGTPSLWEATGLGSGQGSLEKMVVKYETKTDKAGNLLAKDSFEVLFNPNQLEFSRCVAWQPKKLAAHGYLSSFRKLEFVEVKSETLKVSFFFDTYETDTSLAAFGYQLPKPALPVGVLPVPGAGPTASDVRRHTTRVADLASISQELHRPPRCELWWGKRRLFQGVVTSLQQTLTMFLPDGTPVRASMDCTFTQYNTAIDSVRRFELQSSDVAKTYVVKASDSLHAIAAAEYNDASMWRLIAKANGIANPRSVKPGTVLVLPPLPT